MEADAALAPSDVIRAGLEELGIEPAPEVIAPLGLLCVRVAEWGHRINLSGHRAPEAIARRLVLDAAALLTALPSFDSLADLGSGAGFPGLPIAILRPAAAVRLVESRRRRHHFQRAVVRELALSNATPILGRVEDAEPVACDVALAQAMGPISDVLAAIAPWARVDGVRAVPGSIGAARPESPPGCELTEVGYRVPLGGPERILWLVRVASIGSLDA